MNRYEALLLEHMQLKLKNNMVQAQRSQMMSTWRGSSAEAVQLAWKMADSQVESLTGYCEELHSA